MKNYDRSILNHKATIKSIGINPVTYIIIILSLMISIIFSSSLYYFLILFGLFFTFTIWNNLFRSLFIKPMKHFKIFIIFSILFMLLSSYSSMHITIYTLKIIMLLLLSSLFNQFLDYSYILNFFDFYLSKIEPRFLRINSRKILYSFVLGIRSVSELFKVGSHIKKLQTVRGFKQDANLKEKLDRNIYVLRTLFIQSFIIAKNNDRYFIGQGFSFSKQRSFYQIRNFYPKDYFLIVISIIIMVL